VKLVVFGLSLSSSWGNGHATTYRSLLRAFQARGHEITFFEWDAPWYGGANRDLPDPEFASLVLYANWSEIRSSALAESRDADAVVVGSYVHHGVELIDDLAAGGVAPLFFYDIDTPVTVTALRRGGAEYLRPDQVPLFDRYLSFTGGPFLRNVLEREFGARAADPLYCSVDPERYRRTEIDLDLAVDLGYMGTFAPDRQPVLERFLIDVARRLPQRSFIVAGPQYPQEIEWPSNVRHLSHLPPARHAAFYSSAAWQLNATRADMVAAGWSPSVRLFEAGAVGAPVISDFWAGIDELFQRGSEIALPESTEQVIDLIETTSEEKRRAMGEAFQGRILTEHTADRRAEELEGLLRGGGNGGGDRERGTGNSLLMGGAT
jgi:spore maturation protein CgeB